MVMPSGTARRNVVRGRATRAPLAAAMLAAVMLAPGLAGCEDQGEAARLQARAKALETQLAAERKAADTRLDEALKRIAALERRARSGDNRVAAMAIGQVDAERRDKAVRAAMAELRKRLDALEGRTRALADTAATDARADAGTIRKLRKQLDALDARTAPLAKSVGSAESDVALLRTRVSALGRQVETLLAAISPSAKADKEQDRRIQSLTKAVDQITALVGDIDRSGANLADKIDPLTAESKEAASRLRALTAAMGALRTAVDRAENTVARLEKRIRALEAERKR